MDWDLLQSEINAQNHSWLHLSKKLNMSDNGIRKAIKNKSLKIDLFELLCEYLNVAPSHFFKDKSNASEKKCCDERDRALKKLKMIEEILKQKAVG